MLCENLQRFKEITANISVSAMVSNLNIMYFSEMIDFFDQQGINYLCKQIDHPAYFAPGNLPDQFKQQVLDNNARYHDQVKSFLSIGSYDPDRFSKCCNEIQRQDQLKNIRISDYLPLNLLQESTVENL
jgi:hypothetical protein